MLAVATITVLSSSYAVSGESKGLQIQSGSSSGKRSLQIHKATAIATDGEERTFDLKKLIDLGKTPNDFAKKILSKMAEDEAYKLEMFAKWQQHGLSNGEIALKLNVPYSDKYLPLLLEYLNHIPPTVSGVAKKSRVRFGESNGSSDSPGRTYTSIEIPRYNSERFRQEFLKIKTKEAQRSSNSTDSAK